MRHEIVHNTYVVNELKDKGAIFIEDLNDVPPGATVLLVDDLVETGWSATLAAVALREAGEMVVVRAGDLRDAVTMSLAASDSVGAPTTWVLSNHDTVRHTSRLGLAEPNARPNGIGHGDEQPDESLGLRRGRAATLIMLALPGSAYLYQGEELGLPEAVDLPDHARAPAPWKTLPNKPWGRTSRIRIMNPQTSRSASGP